MSVSPTVWDIDLRAPFATFLCAGDARATIYERSRPDGTALPIGPMIQYAPGRARGPRPRGRLLVFPAHSTHYLKLVYDAAGFARTLASYRDRFSHITVCLYWKDILDGGEAPYRAEGFECVTAGHMFDAEFLPRLRGHIENAHTVLANDFGSYLPYAVSLGRPVWLREQHVRPVGAPRDVARDAVPADLKAEATRTIRRLFADEVEEVTSEQRACLEPIAGLGHVRAPDTIRTVLAEAAERYRQQTTPFRRTWHYMVGRVARPLAALVR